MITPPQDEQWKATIHGTYGAFRTSKGVHVEFVQTTLDAKQLAKIDPVRRFFPRSELRFEMLLQRDLDDDRIKEDLIPYLLEDDRVRFFPAISIVIISKQKDRKQIIKSYPALIQELRTVSGQPYKQWVRRFGGLFEVTAFVDPSAGPAENIDQDHVHRSPVTLKVSEDATLLAIDGQHRLIALQAVTDKLPNEEKPLYPFESNFDFSRFDGIQVPVTIMFLPFLHEKHPKVNHLTLAEAFRQIFVDINRNARQVNESRNILLDEHDLNCIFTRNLCSYVQKADGGEKTLALDCIEWDKVEQENQLTRPVSVTNVVFVRDMLRDWLGSGDDSDTGDKFRTGLGLDALRRKLSSKAYLYDQISVRRFSYEQKNLIISHFSKHYLSGVLRILSAMPFVPERVDLVKALRVELSSTSGTPDETATRRKTFEILFEGPEKMTHLSDSKVKALYVKYSQQLQSFDEEHGLAVVRTKMFQKGCFLAALELYANDILIKELSFDDYSCAFGEMFDNECLARWKKALGGSSVLLEYALGNYSVAKWKIEFCKHLLLIAALRPESALVRKGRESQVKDYLKELKDALTNRLRENLKEEVEEEEITQQRSKVLLEQGKKEIATLAK